MGLYGCSSQIPLGLNQSSSFAVFVTMGKLPRVSLILCKIGTPKILLRKIIESVKRNIWRFTRSLLQGRGLVNQIF